MPFTSFGRFKGSSPRSLKSLKPGFYYEFCKEKDIKLDNIPTYNMSPARHLFPGMRRLLCVCGGAQLHESQNKPGNLYFSQNGFLCKNLQRPESCPFIPHL